MSELIPQKRFIDNGVNDRSGENFQQFIFSDLDFEHRKEPISFFRADFRGVNINAVKFYRNNFDRADVINATITDSSFKKCNWGTDIVNTIFRNTTFSDNLMDTCTIHNCFYENCQFSDEKIINTVNRDSTYKNCSFKNCVFEMNTFNDVHFVDSGFSCIDFSNMGAYDLTFDNCQFKQITVDPDYFGSYLIKNTPIESISYAYRGNKFDLTGKLSNDLQTLALFYLENGRYYEAFNATLLFRFFVKAQVSIKDYFQELLHRIKEEANNLIKQEQLNRIVNILIYYADSNVLTAEELFFFIGYLKQLNVKFTTLKEKLVYLNNIELLASTVEAYTFDVRMLSTALELKPIYAEIQIDENDLEKFKKEFHDFFVEVMSGYGLPDEAGYQITGVRKGSLIVEIIGYAVGFYVLATVLKSTVSKFLEIRMEYQLFQKAQKLIDQDINSIESLSKKAGMVRKAMTPPGDEIFKKAKPLSNLMKQFHIFPNALPERRKVS